MLEVKELCRADLHPGNTSLTLFSQEEEYFIVAVDLNNTTSVSAPLQREWET